MDINIKKINPNHEQPRETFDGINELAESIREKGLLEPILVRPKGERYEIIHGERRWKAVKKLGWESIEANIREATDKEAFELSLIENIQRKDLNPIEEAKAFKKLQEDGYTQAKIGGVINKSQQYVADRLTLLNLPDKVQDKITARAISPSIGRRLASIDNKRVQMNLAKRVADENLTVKAVEKRKEIWEREERGIEILKKLAKRIPIMEKYIKAVEKKEIEVYEWNYDDPNKAGIWIKVKDISKEFIGQTWHWPKYSGSKFIDKNEFYHEREILNIPLFTEREWEKYKEFNEKETLNKLKFPGCERFTFDNEGKAMNPENPLNRRTYDHTYGRIIVEDKNICEVCKSPIFIKQGWGEWCILEYNDSEGNRIQRRYFCHDHIGSTLIKEAMSTIDPFTFSAHNFRKMELWKIQPISASWWYLRKKTIEKEKMIEALEKDLERLRNEKPLNDEEFNKCTLDWIQEYIPFGKCGDSFQDWREGIITYKRNPDGTMDREFMERIYDKQAKIIYEK